MFLPFSVVILVGQHEVICYRLCPLKLGFENLFKYLILAIFQVKFKLIFLVSTLKSIVVRI